MAYSVIVQTDVRAKNINSLNRSAKAAADIENGFLVVLASKETGAGETELWAATQPATGSLVNLWMAYSPEIVLTADKYKGLDPDPRNFINVTGDPIDVFKPQVGDLLLMSADAFTGTANDYANAVDGAYSLAWAASAAGSALSLKTISTTTMTIPDGSIGTHKVVAYLMEVETI